MALEKTTSPLAVSLGSLLIMDIDVYYFEINLLLQFVVMYLVGNYYFFNQNLKNGDSQFIVLFCLLSYNSAVWKQFQIFYFYSNKWISPV